MQKISYSCQGAIWKIEVFNKDAILVEIRDTNLFTTEWKIFSINEEHCNKTINIEKNSWWHSLVQTSSNLVFLHELKQGKNPEINGLKIINGVEDHSVDLPNYQLVNIDKEHDCYFISDTNGRVEKKELEESSDVPEVKLPTLYPEESSYFGSFSEIISKHINLNLSLECEYLEINNHIAVGFYEKVKDNDYSYYLLILNSNGNKVYLQKIQQNLKGKMNGIIFALSDKIIYTANNNEIDIITL